MPEPLTITRITHSCHLIQIGDQVVLTDPWFSERAAYHPGEPIAMGVSDLPGLDAVVITHHHYDHCDLTAFSAYRDKNVPMFVAGPVASRARAAGFTRVRTLEPWHSAAAGDLTVTAAPGKHAVYEVTFVISGGGRSVYFAGDTMLIPELLTMPDRVGPRRGAPARQRTPDPPTAQQADRHECRPGRPANRCAQTRNHDPAPLRLYEWPHRRPAAHEGREGPRSIRRRCPAAGTRLQGARHRARRATKGGHAGTGDLRPSRTAGQTLKPSARSCSRPSSVIFSGPHGGSQTQLIRKSGTRPSRAWPA